MNVLAADRGEGISGRRSLLAAHVHQETRQSRHRIAPPHDRSSPVCSCPCWPSDPDDVGSGGGMDEFCALARRAGPRQIRW
jgi:hypothetical protein